MAPVRRFHSFNDDLRNRFGDKVQRVTLTGGLVCPYPDGRDACPWCREAVRRDPNYERGYPVHEQIRRGANFSRRQGSSAPNILVTVQTPHDLPAPADHVRATLEAAAGQEGVVVLTCSAPVEAVTSEFLEAARAFAAPDREVWIDFDSLPDEWPVARDPAVRFGVTVRFEGGTAEPAVDRIIERLNHLSPDAVAFVPPLIVEGSPEAGRYERGEIDEPDLEAFAAGVARVLERIPASVAVHPIVLNGRADQVLGPRWALNRQRVQEALGNALEAIGSAQGDKALAG